MREIEKSYDSPILVIGFRGHPINRFQCEIIYNGEIKNRLTYYKQYDNVHAAYAQGFEDFKKAMQEQDKLYRIEKYTGTLTEFISNKYFRSPIKRKLYKFYLWIGITIFNNKNGQ